MTERKLNGSSLTSESQPKEVRITGGEKHLKYLNKEMTVSVGISLYSFYFPREKRGRGKVSMCFTK